MCSTASLQMSLAVWNMTSKLGFLHHSEGTLVNSAFSEEIRKFWLIPYNGGSREFTLPSTNKKPKTLISKIIVQNILCRTSNCHLNFSGVHWGWLWYLKIFQQTVGLYHISCRKIVNIRATFKCNGKIQVSLG